MYSTEQIIKRKRELLRDLSDNIFTSFSIEDENILHSKHGFIRIKDEDGNVTEGIVGAFKAGLPLVIEDKIIPTITSIDWNNSEFIDEDDYTYLFEFEPIKLSELL